MLYQFSSLVGEPNSNFLPFFFSLTQKIILKFLEIWPNNSHAIQPVLAGPQTGAVSDMGTYGLPWLSMLDTL